MSKWYGKIGYVEEVETRPGIHTPKIIEREYYGDIMANFRKLQNANQVNDNVNIANKLSIVSDPYAVKHFFAMRYAECHGAKWKVTDVEVQYPRLILTLGGLYNG